MKAESSVLRRQIRGFRIDGAVPDYLETRVSVPMQDKPERKLSVVSLGHRHTKTIVLQHGYAGCAETWTYQIRYLAQFAHVIAPDLRGHGQSDAPYTTYDLQELVSDLHAVIEQLASSKTVSLIGHSFGSAIVAEFAVRYPKAVDRVVLVSPTIAYQIPRLAVWAYRLPSWFYRFWWPLRTRYNAEVHVMKRMMARGLRQWHGEIAYRHMPQQTLVITGENDNYFPKEHLLAVPELLRASSHIVVPGAKHKVQLSHPENVNTAIYDFLFGHLS